MMHKIIDVSFLGSFERENQCPKLEKPEFAFIGRSNVGKSSLINMLLDRKGVARTSKKPGKTQTINLFEINQHWVVADLPGYGYATVSKAQRKKWEINIERYLKLRPNLMYSFVLIDIRHPLQKNDLEFMNWLGERAIPFGIVYTKADKLKESKIEEHVKVIQSGIMEYWHMLPVGFVSSAVDKTGRDELLTYIQKLTADFYLAAESRS
jgi:GTP-binding protein